MSGRGPCRRFSAEEDALIIREHSRLTVRDIAARLGREYSTVVARRMRLVSKGILTEKRRYQPEWTEREVAYLESALGERTVAQIARTLGRSETAVLLKKKRLGLRARDKALSLSAVAQIMGVDQHLVHAWVRWGQLAGRRSRAIGAGGKHRMWLVEEDALLAFIEQYPWQYDRTRIDHPFFRRRANEAFGRDPLLDARAAARALQYSGEETFRAALARGRLAGLRVHRRGAPGLRGRSLAGQPILVPRSSIDALLSAGRRNFLREDPQRLSIAQAAELLCREPDVPRWTTWTVAASKLRTLVAHGAVDLLEVPGRARVMTPEAARAVKDLVFERPGTRLWPRRRDLALLARHGPDWLARPRELMRAVVDGRLRTLLEHWRSAERALLGPSAYVTAHVARTLALLGPRTQYRSRLAVYHRRRCVDGLVTVALTEVRAHGLRACAVCSGVRRAA